MKTPVTAHGLTKYDEMSPGKAAIRSWVEPGPHPNQHRRAQEQVRDAMPLLARALDRAAHEEVIRKGADNAGLLDPLVTQMDLIRRQLERLTYDHDFGVQGHTTLTAVSGILNQCAYLVTNVKIQPRPETPTPRGVSG